MKEQEATLDGLPQKKFHKRVTKKHHTTKNVPVEVSVRRQVSEELGDDEPTKDEKFVLLQKYGVTAPRIDRFVTKPSWMGVAEWKRKQNDWFKATKGLVGSSQRPRSNYRPQPNSHQQHSQPTTRPWRKIRFKNPAAQQRHQQDNRLRGTRESLPNSGPMQTATPLS